MTDELKHYAEIAATELDTSSGGNLAEHLLTLSAAIGRVGSIVVFTEGNLLRAERHHRDEALRANGDASEARISAIVKAMTIEERMAFREAETVLHSLHQAFKATQSALSWMKAEARF
jgi:hypothetical protein